MARTTSWNVPVQPQRVLGPARFSLLRWQSTCCLLVPILIWVGWVAGTELSADDANIEELRQIARIIGFVERGGDDRGLDRRAVYRRATEDLDQLTVGPSNRSLLRQAQTMLAVGEADWPRVAVLLQDLPEEDPWFLEALQWRLYARGDARDWPGLASDVATAIGKLDLSQVQFGDPLSVECQLIQQLVQLKTALTLSGDREIPQELRRVIDLLEEFQTALSRIDQQGFQLRIEAIPRDFAWISSVIPPDRDIEIQELDLLIERQLEAVGRTREESQVADREYSAAQVAAMMRTRSDYALAEKRSKKLHRRLFAEERNLRLLEYLQRVNRSDTSVAALPIGIQSGLWQWLRDLSYGSLARSTWNSRFRTSVVNRLTEQFDVPAIVSQMLRVPVSVAGSNFDPTAPEMTYAAEFDRYRKARAVHADPRLEITMALLAISLGHPEQVATLVEEIPPTSSWYVERLWLEIIAAGFRDDFAVLDAAVARVIEWLPAEPPAQGDSTDPNDPWFRHLTTVRLLWNTWVYLGIVPAEIAGRDRERLQARLNQVDAIMSRLRVEDADYVAGRGEPPYDGPVVAWIRTAADQRGRPIVREDLDAFQQEIPASRVRERNRWISLLLQLKSRLAEDEGVSAAELGDRARHCLWEQATARLVMIAVERLHAVCRDELP